MGAVERASGYHAPSILLATIRVNYEPMRTHIRRGPYLNPLPSRDRDLSLVGGSEVVADDILIRVLKGIVGLVSSKDHSEHVNRSFETTFTHRTT